MDYSPEIQFQKSLINREEAKLLTTRNQTEKRQKSGANVASSRNYKLPQMIDLWSLQLEGHKVVFGDGAISILRKEGIRICSSSGREKMSGGRGRWGG